MNNDNEQTRFVLVDVRTDHWLDVVYTYAIDNVFVLEQRSHVNLTEEPIQLIFVRVQWLILVEVDWFDYVDNHCHVELADIDG
jgi:hypothetical protein